MEKQCVKCGEVKPLSEFYRFAKMRDGHRNDCKGCNLAEKSARYFANPEPARRRSKEWSQANRERVLARVAAAQGTEKKKLSDRKSYLKRKFGITLEEYDRMLADQGGACAICGREPRSDISLHVDHEHQSGRIRGLLCFRCNNALGDFDDDPTLLRSAASYVEPPVEREPELERRLEELKRLAAGGTR